MRTVSAAILKQLLENGSVPISAVGRGGMNALRGLLDAGALERARVGAGSVIAVRCQEAVEAVARQLYPSGLETGAAGATTPPRAAAVAAVRDAKRSRRGAAEPVLLRAFHPASLVKQRGTGILPVAGNGRDARATRESTHTRTGIRIEKDLEACSTLELDLLTLTRSAGVAAVTLTQDVCWRFAGRLGIVENLEVFYHIERIVPTLDAALYAGGRLSERVVEWLAGEAMSATELTHFGDYDPVGLAEYLRLKRACGSRVTLFLPVNLPTLMQRFGKGSLLSGRNADLLRELRAETDPAVRTVVTLMDETGCGLEQEALLIDGSS